jgi:hypothetical protein
VQQQRDIVSPGMFDRLGGHLQAQRERALPASRRGQLVNRDLKRRARLGRTEPDRGLDDQRARS